MSRFQPLKRVLIHDVFNTGFNGWMEIMPNFCDAPNFEESPSIVSKHQWPAMMLSTATFRYPGSHGSMSGQYSLKVSTRPVANPYCEPPAPGSMGQAIKRISFHHLKRRYLQFEMWFAYTAEQDKCDGTGRLPGLHEESIRSFGAGWDASGARQALLRRRALPQLGGRQAPEEVADRLSLGQGRPRLGLRHRGRLVHQGRRSASGSAAAIPTAVTTASRIFRAPVSRCATTRRTASSTGSTCAC